MAFWQETEDWHTEGEPFRIVQHPPPGSLQGGLAVAEQRLHILGTPNHPLHMLRRSLCHEPRGHADMYGGFITPPNDAGAHFGVLFFHRDGFSTACGHGTIALGYWALANKIVSPLPDGTIDVIIDVPSGRVVARATFAEGKVRHVDFINVASYHISDAVSASVNAPTGPKSLAVEIAFGGAVYVAVDVAQLGVSIVPANHRLFVDLQHQIKESFSDSCHDGKYDIYGVCFFEHKTESASSIIQRNVVVFADGQIDRSPCGSGTSARLATLFAQSKMDPTKVLTHESIIGTTFEGRILEEAPSLTKFPGCVTQVRGTARLVGKSVFYIDPSDPVHPGFLFR